MHELVDVSVVIVNWKTRELLRQCLTSLVRHTSPETRYEVIVVDNGSNDGSAEMVAQRFSEVRLLCNQENLGFARANNQAIALSSGRYVLLLNSDTELHSDALTAMIGFMDAHPSVGICGPKLLNADDTRQYSCDLFPRTPYVMLRDKIRDALTHSMYREAPASRLPMARDKIRDALNPHYLSLIHI